MSFFAALTLIFIVLKLMGVLASWSWWAVLSPLWGSALLYVIGFAIFVVVQRARGR